MKRLLLLILLLGLFGLPQAVSARTINPRAKRKIQRFLREYRQAWEKKDPFALIKLASPESKLFNHLLNYARFDHIKATSLRLSNITIAGVERAKWDFEVSFTKIHEDLFHIGTVTQGRSDIVLMLKFPEGGSPLIVKRRFKRSSHRRDTIETLFYDGYRTMMDGNFTKAEQLFSQALALNRKSLSIKYLFGNNRFLAQVHFFIGLTWWQAGEYRKAQQAFGRALKENPRFPAALNYLARCFAGTDDTVLLNQAIVLWKRSLNLYSDQPRIRDDLTFHRKALKHYKNAKARKKYLTVRGMPSQKALTVLTQLLYDDPNNVETKRLIATIRLKMNEFKAAEKILLRLYLVEAPKDPESAYLLGRLAIAKNEKNTALKWFNVLWNEKRNFRDTLIFLSDLNGQLGRYRNAISYLKEALKEKPKSAAILYKLGYYHLKLQDYPKARNYFEAAKRANPPLSIRKEIYNLRRI